MKTLNILPSAKQPFPEYLKNLLKINISLNNFSLLLGSSIFAFPFFILLTTCISFVFRHTISFFQIIMSVPMSIGFAWWGTKRLFESDRIAIFVSLLFCFTVLFVFSVYVSGEFYDISFDGQLYHKEAIIQLAREWNPFYGHFENKDINYSNAVWINCYPKGPWIIAAALYKVLGHIEQSKAFNLLFIIASFFICLSALLSSNLIKPKTALILSFLLAFNPIAICQITSFYVDGQLSSLLISLVSLTYLAFKRPRMLINWMLVITVVLAINVKLTGLVYVLIFTTEGVLLAFILKQRKPLLRILQLYLLALLIGILITGFNPYITNAMKYKNPFYPAVSFGKLNITYEHMPKNFHAMNRFERFIVSLFSKSVNTRGMTSFKVPFTYSTKELTSFAGPDTRVGGFGPLFGGGIILALLILAIASTLDLRKTKGILAIIFLIMISVLSNPEAWWARYVPQLWMAPISSIILAIIIRNKFLNYLGYFLIFILLLNMLVITAFYIDNQINFSAVLKNQLKHVYAHSKPNGVYVKFNDFRSSRVWFEELGIQYKEVEKIFCPEYIELIAIAERAIQVCYNQ